jgi:hypothetical protein
VTPGTYDFSIVRGTTQPLIFQLKVSDGATPPVLTNMVFDDVIITIQPKNGTKIVAKISEAQPRFAVTDALENELTFTPTPAETRTYPAGAKTTYEVEVRDGTSQMVYLTGTITATGGINIDV